MKKNVFSVILSLLLCAIVGTACADWQEESLQIYKRTTRPFKWPAGVKLDVSESQVNNGTGRKILFTISGAQDLDLSHIMVRLSPFNYDASFYFPHYQEDITPEKSFSSTWIMGSKDPAISALSFQKKGDVWQTSLMKEWLCEVDSEPEVYYMIYLKTLGGKGNPLAGYKGRQQTMINLDVGGSHITVGAGVEKRFVAKGWPMHLIFTCP